MEAKISFEGPNCFEYLNLSAKDLLWLYMQNMFNIKIVGIEIQKPYKLAV